jgi:hypothetical protein
VHNAVEVLINIVLSFAGVKQAAKAPVDNIIRQSKDATSVETLLLLKIFSFDMHIVVARGIYT